MDQQSPEDSAHRFSFVYGFLGALNVRKFRVPIRLKGSELPESDWQRIEAVTNRAIRGIERGYIEPRVLHYLLSLSRRAFKMMWIGPLHLERLSKTEDTEILADDSPFT